MHTTNDLDLLAKLNDDYIQSVQHSNVKRFEKSSLTTFSARCRTGRCSIARRSCSRRQAGDHSEPPGARRERAADGRFRHHPRANQLHDGDGAESGGRYTDVWARRNGKWLAVSAQ